MQKMFYKIFHSRFWLLILFAIVVLVNIAATQWHARIDLTAEKRFTLSNNTKKMLQTLKEPVTINVFLAGNLPSGFKKLSGAAADVLQEFKEIAGNKIQYRFLEPSTTVEGTEISYADSLSNEGLLPINLTSQVKEGQQQQFVFPYAHVLSETKNIPVTLYRGKTPLINFSELTSAEALLEYNLADAIVKATQDAKPIIGYATGNGEPQQLNTFDLERNVLSPNYRLFSIDLEAQPFVPAEFELLMIVKPTERFSESAKLKLDQYVMHGGKLLIFMDRLNAELDSLQKGEVVAFDRDLNLNDLLFNYGVRVNPDLVMDLQGDFLPFDVSGNGQFELLPWNYFPVMQPFGDNVVTKNLGYVSGRFVNSIDTLETEYITKTILLSSSANARTIGTPAIISGKENETAPQSEKYTRAFIPTAVLLEGKFNSLYRNRVMQWMKDSLDKYQVDYRQQNDNATSMIIVSDGDVVLNSVVKGNQPIPMGMNPYTYGSQREFPFANKEFLMNCLSYLLDKNGLNEAKAKDYVARLLDTKKVEEEKLQWQLINILVPIALLLLFGVVYNIVRKRKYS